MPCPEWGGDPRVLTKVLTKKIFLVDHSEKANLAVTLVNANNDVIAFAAFFDYPNIPSVDQAQWEEWLKEKYDCTKANVSTYSTNIYK